MNVGLIIHPIDVDIVRNNLTAFYPKLGWLLGSLVRNLDDYQLKNVFTKMPTHKFMDLHIAKNLSVTGMMVPLFPINMIRNKERALAEIQKAFRIAKKEHVDILTLAAFTSIVSSGGDDLPETCSTAFTTGNTLTAALCIEGIERSLKFFDKDLSESNVTIIGAGGDIGSACSLYFAQHCKNVILCTRNMGKSKELHRTVSVDSVANIMVENDIDAAIKGSDVILSVASSFGSIFDDKHLKKGAIICDAGMPPNFASNINREDIFVFDGGKASVEFYEDLSSQSWKALFPHNSIYGCFAEALTLAMTGRLENYSYSKGKITKSRLREIKLLANSTGIALARFSRMGILYDDSDLEKIKEKVAI